MSNILRVGQLVTPTQANGGISPGCIACYPCHQATTDTVLTDISGNGNHGSAGVAMVPATAFGSPQGLLTAEAASTDTTERLALGNFTYNYNNGDTLLIATRVKLSAIPAATKPLWAQGGNSSAAPGFALNVQSSGLLSHRLDNVGSSQFGSNTDAGGVAGDGKMDASEWRTVVFAWWNHNVGALTANYGIWIDGVSAYAAGPKSATSLPASINPTEAFRIGQYYRTVGPTTASIGALHSYIHIYRAPNAVSNTLAKMDALAKRLHRCPSMPLNAVEWPMV